MQQRIILLLLVTVVGISQCSQRNSNQAITAQERVGGRCEGCEAIFESPVPFEQLSDLTRLPDFIAPPAAKPIGINGTVYKKDGKTPAPGVIIYVYHTDQAGIYPTKGDEKGWGKRHGYIRGWMRTNEKGEYKFMTLRPAAYPGRKDPAHIHVTIKEPDKNEYWIDEYLFADDPLLTESEKRKCEDRGGSGILQMKDVGNMFKAERNIYLGRNIPNYPE
jgi:protocatechuate 3,4-dioxygenase, beta subunit